MPSKKKQQNKKPKVKKTAKRPAKKAAEEVIPKNENTKSKKSFLLRSLGGRPPKYSNASELIERATEYFKLCDEHWQLPEKAGLCLYLGITRETYSQYRKNKEFSDTIKGIDNYIESCWVRRLAGQAATGAIFYLKNAFRDHFKDKQETDITSGGELIIGFNYVKPNPTRKNTNA